MKESTAKPEEVTPEVIEAEPVDDAIVPASVVSNLAAVNASSIYNSITGTDANSKKIVYNALNNSESLADNIGVEFDLEHVIAVPVTVESLQEPGVMVEGTRIVLVAADGRTFGCMSTGVLGALERMFAIFGQPADWAEPIRVKAIKKRGKKGLEFTTLELV